MRMTAAMLALLLLVSGCGGGESAPADGADAADGAADAPTDGGEDAATDAEPAETGAPVTLEGNVNDHGVGSLDGALQMTLGDFYFEPTYVGAQPGATAQLTLVNAGEVSHTFTIDELGIDESLEGGAESQVEVTLPDQLPLVFYCRFHRAQGMQGAFFSG